MGQRQENFHYVLPVFRIQITGGLICKNYLGLGSQCPGDGHSLLLTAAHTGRQLFFNALWQAYTPEQFFCCLSRLLSLFVIEFHRVHHIFQSIEQGEKMECLVDYRNLLPAVLIPVQFLQGTALIKDISADRQIQAGQQGKQGGLSAAGLAHNGIKFSHFKGAGDII